MEDQRDLVYAGVGPLAAILIGMALVPFRDFTSASNFTFVFLALIILVAELGGRAAALLTAVTAALSLNFFLTQPYLRLTIHSRDDVIAFAGLGACGLLAAALGAQRSRRKQDLEAARRHLQLLHVTLSQVEVAGPVEPALGRVLNALEGRLPVVRRRRSRRTEPRGRRLGPGLVHPVPERMIRDDTLLAPDGRTCSQRRRPLALVAGTVRSAGSTSGATVAGARGRAPSPHGRRPADRRAPHVSRGGAGLGASLSSATWRTSCTATRLGVLGPTRNGCAVLGSLTGEGKGLDSITHPPDVFLMRASRYLGTRCAVCRTAGPPGHLYEESMDVRRGRSSPVNRRIRRERRYAATDTVL